MCNPFLASVFLRARTDVVGTGSSVRNQAIRWGLWNGVLSPWHEVVT